MVLVEFNIVFFLCVDYLKFYIIGVTQCTRQHLHEIVSVIESGEKIVIRLLVGMTALCIGILESNCGTTHGM